MAKYQLSESFTSSNDGTPILRLPDGNTLFRVISESFMQCLSLFVKTDDGKGYSKMWEHGDDQPDLPAGHTYESRKPKRVVLFKVITEDEKPHVLAAPISVAEQLLEEANACDGLTIAWMQCRRRGKGLSTQYIISAQDASDFKSEWEEMADELDFSEAVS